jgi:hypothetical protein
VTKGVALVIAGGLFVAFLLVRLLGPRLQVGRVAKPEDRAALEEALARARDRSLDQTGRAGALREAAEIALERLGRSGLAASYARRAERLDPTDPAIVAVLSRAMWERARYRALERLLWKRIARGGVEGQSVAAAVAELVKLYRGPLRRPEIADGLERLT